MKICSLKLLVAVADNADDALSVSDQAKTLFAFSANGFLILSNFIKKSSIIDLFFALCFSAANRGLSVLRISLQQTSFIFAGISPVVFFPPTPSPSNCFSPIQLSLASFNCSSASTSSFVLKKSGKIDWFLSVVRSSRLHLVRVRGRDERDREEAKACENVCLESWAVLPYRRP